jgi:hypothetical protein
MEMNANVTHLLNVRLVGVEVTQLVVDGDASLGSFHRAVREANYIPHIRSLWRETHCETTHITSTILKAGCLVAGSLWYGRPLHWCVCGVRSVMPCTSTSTP